MRKIILLDYQTGIAHIFEIRSSKNLVSKVRKWCEKESIRFTEYDWMAYEEIITHKTTGG